MTTAAPLRSADTRKKLAGVIEKSFDARPMPSGDITQGEVNRRVDLAKEIFDALFNECHWTEQRIMDHLPTFLVRGLDGEEPIPEWAKRKVDDDESAMWGAEAAGRVEKERRLSALAGGNKFVEHEAGQGGPTILVPEGYEK
jgi:hypothetical protein